MVGPRLMLLSFTLLVASPSSTLGEASSRCRVATAYFNEETRTVILKDEKSKGSAVAWGVYSDQINETGWAFLEVYSNETFPDALQAYAAGAVEGHLTRDLIQKQWSNMYAHYCDNQTKYCDRLHRFLNDNLRDVHRQALLYESVDPYWHQVHMQLKQLRGLSDAFESYALAIDNEYVNVTRVLFFNIEGDLLDLESAFERKKGQHDIAMVPMCTAFIKVINDSQDIYFAHDSWFVYRSMLRIQKKYSLPLHFTTFASEVVPGHTISMSSYPGKLVSLDDFYLTSGGLAVTETSIENNNATLWRFLTPNDTVLTWIRGSVANRLSVTSQDWVSLFRQHNSGTYNNQWMVLDYKLFTPFQPIPNGTLWILEQMPTIIEVTDASHILRSRGYWPSYNVAYFPSIFNISGQPQLVAKYGGYYSYEGAPRAQIFSRDHNKVVDMDSMITFMRYNDYKHDPASRCNCTPPYNPAYAISSRYDLLDPNGKYDVPRMHRRAVGGIDMKLTNYTLFKTSEFVGISGPTFQSVPAFQWSTSEFTDSHLGQPDSWTFGPVQHRWGTC